jgi:D-sedoheptulose 7-phosphate isomerase
VRFSNREDPVLSMRSNPIERTPLTESFSETFLSESAQIMAAIDTASIERIVSGLSLVRDRGGRLFILGVGGSAGHASHAVNDFRKLCGFEAYAPTDNVSELTARANDEGWDSTFEGWLRGSRLSERDAILVFSVGGGSMDRNVSVNLVRAIDLAVTTKASIFGIVGRDGGHTKRHADECIVIPPFFDDHVTPHTEGLCAVLWHLIVSHPSLSRTSAKWESMK